MAPVAEPALPAFPPLDTIAFRNDDLGDHVGGGHCAGVPDDVRERWVVVLEQHMTAFNHLVTQATATGDGWALTRPVLFAAHHVCEVALKTAAAALDGREPKQGHPLEPHWTRLGRAGGLRHLSPAQINEGRAFIDFMSELTPDGSSTRYPLLGSKDLGAEWCCLNVEALRDAVHAFVFRLDLMPRGDGVLQ